MTTTESSAYERFSVCNIVHLRKHCKMPVITTRWIENNLKNRPLAKYYAYWALLTAMITTLNNNEVTMFNFLFTVYHFLTAQYYVRCNHNNVVVFAKLGAPCQSPTRDYSRLKVVGSKLAWSSQFCKYLNITVIMKFPCTDWFSRLPSAPTIPVSAPHPTLPHPHSCVIQPKDFYRSIVEIMSEKICRQKL